MNELSPEDTAYFIRCLFDWESSQLSRLITISYVRKLAVAYPLTRPAFVRAFAGLLLITQEPPIAERLVQALLNLRVKESAGYIQIAFEKGLLASSFLGGWKKVQTRLARSAAAAPVVLPSPDGVPDEFWRSLLLGPGFPQVAASSKQTPLEPEV